MQVWNDFVYCLKCDRPLRECDYSQSENVRGDGQRQTIRRCNYCFRKTVGSRRLGVFPPMLIHMFLFITLSLLCWVFQDDKKVSVVIGFFALVPAGFHQMQKFKLKPIYDRWVHQHGTDPDKWPDATKPQ